MTIISFVYSNLKEKAGRLCLVCGFSLFFVFSLICNGMHLSELLYGIGLCSVRPDFLAVNTNGPPYIVAIDPGHGGMDTGALAIVKEYQVIDTTARALFDLLDADADFVPLLTRTDTDPSNDERAAAAASAGADLLISIHANSDSHSSSKGFECFAQPPGRIFHRQSYNFASFIVRQMAAAGHTIRGDEQKTGIKYAYYYGNDKRIVDSSDDKVRSRKSFGILEKSPCPRVLVEQCFITNHSDVENWATQMGCNRAAQAYYQAIKQYFSEI